MGFAVEWAPRAEDDLDRLPVRLLSFVIDGIYQFADDPVRLSRRPSLANQVYQRYSFSIDLPGESFEVLVFFQYTQDEMAIEIAGVVATPF